MPSSCVIPSCIGKYSHAADISFHKFPHKDSVLLQKWIDFVVKERGSEWKPSRWSSICSRHFAVVDFRQHCGRKCLKIHAIPTLLTLREDSTEIESPPAQMCNLCGQQTKKLAVKEGNEIPEWIAKCFPSLTFEKSPLEIIPCEDCYNKLKTFSHFVDTVASCQRNRVKYPHDKMSQERQKPVNIKQEVKEEMKTNEVHEVEPHIEDIPTQTSCDQYLDEIFNQPDEVENCEIMEISDLEKVFIDIAEETSDTEVKIPPKNRIEIISSISVKTELKPEGWFTDFAAVSLHIDHTYAKSPFSIDNRCKMEKPEVPGEKPSTPRINIIKNLVIPHRCDKCPAHFDTLTALSDHRIGNHAPWKKSRCSVCGEFFGSTRECLVHRFTVHRERKSSRRIKCRNCGQDFPSILVRSHHERFLCCSRKGICCTVCMEEFPKLLELRRHSLKNHPEHLRKKFPRKSQMREDGRYGCSLCNKTFGRNSNLRRHERLHRPKRQWDQKCDCGQTFDKPRDLRRHVNTSPHCSTFRIEHTKLLPLEFMCSVCGRQFSSPNGLKLHESSHQPRTIKPPNVCETCGKHFQRASLLWQHRISHTDARNFACKLCPKVFKRSNGLHQHIQGFHMKLRPHVCTVCQRGYALKADMKRCRHSWLKME